MRLLQALRAKYPDMEFEQDPETAIIACTANGFAITDPFLSECGRFDSEDRYGLALEDALALYDHNLPLGATYGNRPEA